MWKSVDMKAKIVLLGCAMLMSGCGQIGKNAIADPSAEQAQVAQAVYDQLREGNLEKLYPYLDRKSVV